jgi:hypothetical protein
MDKETMVTIRSGLLAVIISFFLYKMSATSTLFIIPLLFVAPKLPSDRWALIPVGVVAVALTGYHIIGYAPVLSEPYISGTILVGLFLPITLLVGTAIFIIIKRSTIEKLLYATLFAAFYGFSLMIWFKTNSEVASVTAEVYYQAVKSAIPVVFSESLPLGLDESSIFASLVKLIRLGFLPLFVGQFALSVFITKQMQNRNNVEFQDKLSNFSLPEITIWPFLISLTLVLFSAFINMVPIETLGWNIGGVLFLAYMVQGIAIVTYLIRKKSEIISATRIYIFALILMVIPPINVLPLLGLPLLGISETWVKLRKV